MKNYSHKWKWIKVWWYWNWKKRFYCHKCPVPLRDADIEKVIVSKKISFRWKNCKYLFGYLYNDHKVKPLYIMLPKTSTYLKFW